MASMVEITGDSCAILMHHIIDFVVVTNVLWGCYLKHINSATCVCTREGVVSPAIQAATIRSKFIRQKNWGVETSTK